MVWTVAFVFLAQCTQMLTQAWIDKPNQLATSVKLMRFKLDNELMVVISSTIYILLYL